MVNITIMTDESKLELLRLAVNKSDSLAEAEKYAKLVLGIEQKDVDSLLDSDNFHAPYKLFVKYANGVHSETFTHLEGTPIGISVFVLGKRDMSFTVGLRDKGVFTLLKDDDSDDEDVKYYPREVDALHDWDAEANTASIIKRGTDIPLIEGEFIPSLAQLAFIGHIIEPLNESLKIVGGEPLDTVARYLSSTESDASGAWYLYLNDGTLDGWTGKSQGKTHVRPVSVF